MKRDIDRLARESFDLLVVGGGIYGACIARDAALRGLTVALLEKEDFGHATSANSLKILHGGLRYVQDGRPGLVRRMAHESRTWRRIAPHLVRPLPCLMPATNQLSRSRALLSLGMKINDLLAYERPDGTAAVPRLPHARILERDEALRLLPGVPSANITGALLWYDAQVTNTDRLLLAIVHSAVEAGAQVANYVEVTGFLRHGEQIRGISAVDGLTGREIEVQARLVVVCAGAWAGALLEQLDGRIPAVLARPSLAFNLVTRRLAGEHALALPTRSANGAAPGPRTLFVVPWGQYSLVGTLHVPFEERADLDAPVREEMITRFLTVINTAYPPAQLALADVCRVQAGYLPALDSGSSNSQLRLLRESQILDYERIRAIAGLIVVNGVKYTTARWTAEKVVDLALQKLKRPARASVTGVTPVAGGEGGDLAALEAGATQSRAAGLEAGELRHLLVNYGTGYERVAQLAAEEPAWAKRVEPSTPVLAAEIVHAVRDEMALRLADVVRRRTTLGAAGPPGAVAVEASAALMGDLLGWSPREQQEEIDHVQASYQNEARPTKEMARA